MTNSEKLAAALETLESARKALYAAPNHSQEMHECLDAYRDAAIAYEHACDMAREALESDFPSRDTDMTNERILSLVRAYGDACTVHATATARYAAAERAIGNDEAVVRERCSAFNAASRAEDAAKDALRAVESALATFVKDR